LSELDEQDSKSNDESKRSVRHVVEKIARQAFRRPVRTGELDHAFSLAETAIDEGLSTNEAIRLSLRGILTSPQFLFLSGNPDPLDDHSLASRLSYFLWKSLPDEELLDLANKGLLSNPDTLTEQTKRLLNDPKATRFIRDFLGQWLRLYDIDATTPDKILYPEFNDILRQAMLDETELFFKELFHNNRSVSHLIASDSTFLNRELAEHYGIHGIEGLHMRQVSLAADRIRGGILAQASIHKVTANGTTTSPVRRGNFVLTHFLGQPTSPPPANVGSIEPDIRGATTIRETLAAHRDTQSCAKCHQHIDPPGFALENFDAIGGFRNHYRKLPDPSKRRRSNRYVKGLPVDSSGTTPLGESFNHYGEFKQILLEEEKQGAPLARHLISRLIVYATGAEIQFADRTKVERILRESEKHGHRIRDIIHLIVQSNLFRNK
jgi:hypothetical protein